MSKNLPAWATLAFLLLFAALTFWLDRVVQPAGPKLDGSARHEPDYIVDNFNAIKLDLNGQPHFTLAAVKMTHFPDDLSTQLIRPHFIGFNPKTAPYHMYAQRGTVTEDGEHAYFYDNVRVVREASGNATELTMSTSYLHVIPEKDFAETDKPVVIQDAHTLITAVGLKLDKNSHQLKLLSRVKARYAPPPR